MLNAKQLGICVDDDGLHIMRHTPGAVQKIVLLPFINTDEADTGFKKSESFVYDVELQQQTNYFSQLKAAITHNDNLLFFGPTNLKVELYNRLREDNGFAKTDIEVKQTDTMTGTQQQAFVMDYFENRP